YTAVLPSVETVVAGCATPEASAARSHSVEPFTRYVAPTVSLYMSAVSPWVACVIAMPIARIWSLVVAEPSAVAAVRPLDDELGMFTVACALVGTPSLKSTGLCGPQATSASEARETVSPASLRSIREFSCGFFVSAAGEHEQPARQPTCARNRPSARGRAC